MTNYFLDTNIILRYLIKDNHSQYKQAKTWFKKAEKGSVKLIITPVVVAESCFVLESFYKTPRSEITDKFLVLLSTRWLKVTDRDALLKMWDFYKAGLHFVDSFLLALAKENKGKVLSFDKQISSKSTNT